MGTPPKRGEQRRKPRFYVISKSQVIHDLLQLIKQLHRFGIPGILGRDMFFIESEIKCGVRILRRWADMLYA